MDHETMKGLRLLVVWKLVVSVTFMGHCCHPLLKLKEWQNL
jgi:hypothetical protein